MTGLPAREKKPGGPRRQVLGQDQEELLMGVARQIAVDDIAAVVDTGASCAQALDYWATQVVGVTAREWADCRDVSVTTIHTNRKGAEERIIASSNDTKSEAEQ